MSLGQPNRFSLSLSPPLAHDNNNHFSSGKRAGVRGRPALFVSMGCWLAKKFKML